MSNQHNERTLPNVCRKCSVCAEGHYFGAIILQGAHFQRNVNDGVETEFESP